MADVDAEAERRRLLEARSRLEERRSAILQSACWRWTAPLRWAMDLLRRLRGAFLGPIAGPVPRLPPLPEVPSGPDPVPRESREGCGTPRPDPAPVPDAAALASLQLRLFKARRGRIPVPRRGDPEVSIVIPVWNRAALTLSCLAGLGHGGSVPFETLVVDNGSTDGTDDLAARLEGVRVLRNATNEGFGRACNQAAAQARGRWIVFLNNDTWMMPGSLDALVEAVESRPRVGAVGGCLVRFDGTIQEAGGLVFRDGTTRGYGRGDPLDSPRTSFRRPVVYASGALLLTPAELFREVGGFAPEYGRAYYEDVDYCFRLQARGYEVLFEPAAAVLHHESASSGSWSEAGAQAEANRRVFVARHADRVARAPSKGAGPSERDRSPDDGRPWLLYVVAGAAGLGGAARDRIAAEAGEAHVGVCFLADDRDRTLPAADLVPVGVEPVGGDGIGLGALLDSRIGVYDRIVPVGDVARARLLAVLSESPRRSMRTRVDPGPGPLDLPGSITVPGRPAGDPA